MSIIKSVHEDKALQRLRSIEIILRQDSQDNKTSLHKINRSKYRYNNHSLHSLQVQKHSLNIPERVKTNRRRLVIQSLHQHKQLFSQRPIHISNKDHLNIPNHQTKPNSLHSKVNRHDFISSIDQLPLYEKQKKIKNCIQLMQGVLQNIKIEKSQRRILKSKKHINLQMQDSKQHDEQGNKQKSVSKLQKYVRNVCNLKQDNGKSIKVKINKNKSYNRQNIRSSIMLNLQKFQTVNDKPKQIKLYDPLSTKKRKPYFDSLDLDKNPIIPSLTQQSHKPQDQSHNKNLQQIDFSIIKKVNDSSFISSKGRQSLIKHLQDQNKQKQTIIQGNNNKLILKIKNHRKLKNMFPYDFF